MSDSPENQTNPDIPAFADLLADPEIAALLDFEPVPRQLQKANGWAVLGVVAHSKGSDKGFLREV